MQLSFCAPGMGSSQRPHTTLDAGSSPERSQYSLGLRLCVAPLNQSGKVKTEHTSASFTRSPRKVFRQPDHLGMSTGVVCVLMRPYPRTRAWFPSGPDLRSELVKRNGLRERSAGSLDGPMDYSALWLFGIDERLSAEFTGCRSGQYRIIECILQE